MYFSRQFIKIFCIFYTVAVLRSWGIPLKLSARGLYHVSEDFIGINFEQLLETATDLHPVGMKCTGKPTSILVD